MTLAIHSDLNVRTVLCDGETYYCAKDLGCALGYVNLRKAARDHVSRENDYALVDLVPRPMGKNVQPHSHYLSAAGVRELLTKSQQPNVFEIGNKLG